MTEYERYANELAAKYGVDPLDRYYEGDCVVWDPATPDEQDRMARLWERCHTDELREW